MSTSNSTSAIDSSFSSRGFEFTGCEDLAKEQLENKASPHTIEDSVKVPHDNTASLYTIEDLVERLLDSDDKVSVETFAFSKIGITVHGFKELIYSIGESKLQGLNTTQVCEMFIKPMTLNGEDSYCDMLLKQNSRYVGDAKLFVSHAWKYSFLDVVNAIITYVTNIDASTNDVGWSSLDDCVIWFDLFSNNQHRAVDLGFNWWCTTFRSAIERFGHTVLVLSPWHDPIPFTRAWCLYEIYCSAVTNSKLDVAMSLNDENAFLDSICKDPSGYMDMLSRINVQRSESWNPSDCQNIFAVVERDIGFHNVNKVVTERMRDLVINVLKKHIVKSSFDEVNIKRKIALAETLREQSLNEESMDILRSIEMYLTENKYIEGENMGNVSSCVATILECLGKYDDALEYHEKSLSIRLNCLEKDHPDVAQSYNSIGSVYDDQGEYEKAFEYYNKSLMIRIKSLGDDHPDVAKSYNNLGLLYNNQGQYEKALEYYNKSLFIRLKSLGDDHLTISQSYNNIGLAYRNEGQYEKALEYYNKSLLIRLKCQGEDHPNVADLYNNLGVVYDDQGQCEKALEYYNKALFIWLKSLGEDHQDIALSYNNIGVVYDTQGENEKALEYYNKSLLIRLKSLGEDHPDVAESYNNIGFTYRNQGHYEKALEYYNKSLLIRLKTLGEDHPDVAESYNNIGVVYDNQGQYEKALESLNKSLLVWLKSLGEDHPDVALSYNNFGLTYRNQGNYQKALEYYNKSLLIRLKTLGEDHPDVAESYANIHLCVDR